MTPATRNALRQFFSVTMLPILLSGLFLFVLGVSMSFASTAATRSDCSCLVLFTKLVDENWVPSTMILSLAITGLLGGISFFAVAHGGAIGTPRRILYDLTEKFSEFSFGITALGCGLIFASIIQQKCFEFSGVRPLSSIGDWWSFVLLPLYCVYFRLGPKHAAGMPLFSRVMGTFCVILACLVVGLSSWAAAEAKEKKDEQKRHTKIEQTG